MNEKTKKMFIGIGARILFTLAIVTSPIWVPAVIIISGFVSQRKRDEWDSAANKMSGLA